MEPVVQSVENECDCGCGSCLIPLQKCPVCREVVTQFLKIVNLNLPAQAGIRVVSNYGRYTQN
jgi:hypothetical protein